MKRITNFDEWKRIVAERGAVSFDYDGLRSIVSGRGYDGISLGWFDTNNSIGVIKEQINPAIAVKKPHFELHEQLKDKHDLMLDLESEIKFLKGDENFIPKSIADIKSGKVKMRDVERVALTFKKIVDLMRKLGM